MTSDEALGRGVTRKMYLRARIDHLSISFYVPFHQSLCQSPIADWRKGGNKPLAVQSLGGARQQPALSTPATSRLCP